MADPRPKEYHTKFWSVLADYPEVEQAFRASGFDWEKLPTEQKEICKAADRLAWADVQLRKSANPTD